MTPKNKTENNKLPKPKSQAEPEHFFQFPGVYGVQGGTKTIMLNAPARTLERILTRDSLGHALERSQRELNNQRVKKIVAYLTEAARNGTPFIIPALTGNCDCEIDFEPIGNSMAGIVRIPMDAKIKLFDGQHRAAGIMDFIRNYDLPLSVPVLLTEQLSLKTRQQFFSDINNNASKPSATINMVYDGRDDVAQIMVKFLRGHDVFSVITDFENNVVPSRKSYFVSFKAICDATSKFIGAGESQLSTESLRYVWQAWTYLTAIAEIKGGVKQHEYKKDYIQFHGVMINAFGYAIAELSKDNDISKVIAMIEQLAVSTDTWQKEEAFLIKNWAGICVDGARIMANVASQRAAAARLVEFIRRGSFSI